jgi:nucleoid DNA-binding protein
MRTKRTKQFIEDTATEHGVKPSQVKEVADSMFEFVAEVMSEGDRKSLNFAEIRLMGWGVFRVKEGRRKQFEKINNERINNTGQ